MGFRRLNMLINIVLLTAAAVINFENCIAQDQLILQLDDAIEIALDKSYRIKSLRKQVIMAERNLWAAKAGYRTNIDLNFFAPQYDEGFALIKQVEGNPVVKQEGSFKVRGVIDITQPMPWLPFGGGHLTLQSEAYQLNSWTPMAMMPDEYDRENMFFTSLSLIVNKPLFTINNVSLELRQARLNYTSQRKFFKRSELDLIYQVTQSFYQLYKMSQEMNIKQDKVERQSNIYETTKNKYNSGLIAEVEAMQAEVDLIQARNDLKSTEGFLEKQKAAFKQLIGLSFNEKIKVTTDLHIKLVEINIDQAIDYAMKNRSEIIENKIEIENQEITIQQIDARVAIKGNLTGYYRFAGFSEQNLPWGTPTVDLIESSWNILRQTPNRGITFNLEVPIWDWGRNRAQVEAAEAELERKELKINDLYKTIEREVRDAVRSVFEAYDRVEMLSKSKEVSQKSFDISLKRFSNGDITSTELARASEQLDTSLLTYLSAYNQYRLALADLQRKTLYDFEKGITLVEDE